MLIQNTMVLFFTFFLPLIMLFYNNEWQQVVVPLLSFDVFASFSCFACSVLQSLVSYWLMNNNLLNSIVVCFVFQAFLSSSLARLAKFIGILTNCYSECIYFLLLSFQVLIFYVLKRLITYFSLKFI